MKGLACVVCAHRRCYGIDLLQGEAALDEATGRPDAFGSLGLGPAEGRHKPLNRSWGFVRHLC